MSKPHHNRENRLTANWEKQKEKKKNSNAQLETKLKSERKNNLNRKQEAWKEKVENAKRPKLNPAQAQNVNEKVEHEQSGAEPEYKVEEDILSDLEYISALLGSVARK